MQNSHQQAVVGVAVWNWFSAIPEGPATMITLISISLAVPWCQISLWRVGQQQLKSQLYVLTLCSESLLHKFFAKTQHGKRQLPVISIIMFGKRIGAMVHFAFQWTTTAYLKLNNPQSIGCCSATVYLPRLVLKD